MAMLETRMPAALEAESSSSKAKGHPVAYVWAMWSAHRQLAQISEQLGLGHAVPDSPMCPNKAWGRDLWAKDRPDLFCNTAEDSAP